MIAIGQRLPEATLTRLGEDGPEEISVTEMTSGRTVVIFGVPGAFTPTCSEEHVPGFVREAGALRGKGVDELVCISVNDPFVLKEWGKATGATDAGIDVLSDVSGEFTAAIGLDFNAPKFGFFGRCKRFSTLVEDGVVKVLNVEEDPGACRISSGEALVNQL